MADKQHNNARQIALYQTNKYLLEANDNLQVVDNAENASHLHGRFSKVQLLGLNYTDKAKSVSALFNVDPDQFLLLAHDVLTGQFGGQWSEQKLNSYQKREDGKVKMSTFKVDYSPTDKDGKPRSMCWAVTIENGWATPEQSQLGGTYAKKGTYEREKADNGQERSVKVFFTHNDFRKFILKVQNYIRDFERMALAHALRIRAQLEQEQKAKEQSAANQ